MEIIYKNLQENEISRELFRHFVRHQTVVKCRRKENGKWIIKDDPFIDDWSEADYKFLVSCLRNTAATGGLVYAAFCEGVLKGFVSSIHVSEDMRGKGVGTALFRAAKEWAKAHGAKKLYISAHSAVESQAFYHKMGCAEAAVYNQSHVETEPYDCQLECKVCEDDS